MPHVPVSPEVHVAFSRALWQAIHLKAAQMDADFPSMTNVDANEAFTTFLRTMVSSHHCPKCQAEGLLYIKQHPVYQAESRSRYAFDFHNHVNRQRRVRVIPVSALETTVQRHVKHAMATPSPDVPPSVLWVVRVLVLVIGVLTGWIIGGWLKDCPPQSVVR